MQVLEDMVYGNLEILVVYTNLSIKFIIYSKYYIQTLICFYIFVIPFLRP